MADIETTAMKAEILTEQILELKDTAEEYRTTSPHYALRLIKIAKGLKAKRDTMLHEAL